MAYPHQQVQVTCNRWFWRKTSPFGTVQGKHWRPREAATILACSIHSGERLGPEAEMGLR